MSGADARVRWQCRRGMRELDELLLGYFEHGYGGSNEAEKAAFRELLALPDPDLVRYLLTVEAIPHGVSALVVERIRSRSGSDERPA